MNNDIKRPSAQEDDPTLQSELTRHAGDLEWAKLVQERELREKELTLKEKELELRRKQEEHDRNARDREIQLNENDFTLRREQSWWAKWSTPAVVAILAGLIGYIGTLISTWQNRNLERDRQEATLNLEREKQEGTLILEAIKTAGTAEEKERLTAANLVFLADAGLITSMKKDQLDKLRGKAGSAIPSLPAPTVQNVDFTPDPLLTSQLQSRLQVALLDYQFYLTKIGYDAKNSRNRIIVRIDKSTDELDKSNAYFSNDGVVVLGPKLAKDPEYVLSEYTWQVLKEVNPPVYKVLSDADPLDIKSAQSRGFSQGLKFYLTCSYFNDPHVGKNYYSLTGAPAIRGNANYLYNLKNSLVITNDIREEHFIGEIWGGALWELREKLGRDRVDQWALTTWKRLQPLGTELNRPKYYADIFVQTVRSSGDEASATLAREIFKRRNLS
jgi:hypothetical protein